MNSLKYLFGLYLFLLIFTIILCVDNNNNTNTNKINSNKTNKTKTINSNNNNNVKKNVQGKSPSSSVSIRSTENNQEKSSTIKSINSISTAKTSTAKSTLKLNSDVATSSSTKISLKTSLTTPKKQPIQNTTPSSSTLKKSTTGIKNKAAVTTNNNSVGGVKKKAITTTTTKFDDYLCPKQTEFQWFPQFCNKHTDCKQMGKQFRCCKFNNKRCVRGIPKPIEEPKHSPLLGVIPRRCPKEPLAELFWEVQTCNTDQDCWPRICCPDGRIKYCRTSDPDLNALPFPVAKQIAYPLQSASEYLQCTAPPPPLYDLHPKPCKNTWDCFPNVCCQELGKKHCRPPRRSLLALVAGFAQRFNTGIVKQWTDNLVIK